MKRAIITAGIVLAFAQEFARSPRAEIPYEIVRVSANKSEDVYSELNMSGHIYLAIHDEFNGIGCGTFWWIVWPFGSIRPLGRLCGRISLEIPGWTSLAVAAKLRVRTDSNALAIVVSTDEQVANSIHIELP